MSLKTEQLGPAKRNKYGRAKPAKYRKFVKNQTARKKRRVPKSKIPNIGYAGYD